MRATSPRPSRGKWHLVEPIVELGGNAPWHRERARCFTIRDVLSAVEPKPIDLLLPAAVPQVWR